ncbi:MAG TPA: hypothetical protein VMH03_18660, partial [Terriglobales bacterium]|nr:hypothetical protein [Terriglobales bacterium]
MAELADEPGEPTPASTTDSSSKHDQSQMVSPFVGVEHRKRAADRFQWKPALAQYWFEISIQHAWRFAHEAG